MIAYVSNVITMERVAAPGGSLVLHGGVTGSSGGFTARSNQVWYSINFFCETIFPQIHLKDTT